MNNNMLESIRKALKEPSLSIPDGNPYDVSEGNNEIGLAPDGANFVKAYFNIVRDINNHTQNSEKRLILGFTTKPYYFGGGSDAATKLLKKKIGAVSMIEMKRLNRALCTYYVMDKLEVIAKDDWLWEETPNSPRVAESCAQQKITNEAIIAPFFGGFCSSVMLFNPNMGKNLKSILEFSLDKYSLQTLDLLLSNYGDMI